MGARRTAPAAREPIPREIAGFPTELSRFALGAETVEIVTVRDLESQLDRQRLLADAEYEPPYWALPWSGARILARHLVAAIDCGGRTLLDVGCGLGLTAIAAARRGARVTALDRTRSAVEFVRASALWSGVGVGAVQGDALRLPSRQRFDVVVAAEILYDPAAFTDLATSLAGALAEQGSLWIADARRIDTSAFFTAAEGAGLRVASSELHEVREESTPVVVRIVELRHAEPGAVRDGSRD